MGFSEEVTTNRSVTPVWAKVAGEWHPLFGNFFEEGVSVEWHDFECARTLDWSRSFHPDSLEIWQPLNPRVRRGAEEMLKPPLTGSGGGFWFRAKIMEIAAPDFDRAQ